MNAVFADAGYWIALFNPRDQLHDKAVVAAQATQERPNNLQSCGSLPHSHGSHGQLRPSRRFPYRSSVVSSRQAHRRELRVQYAPTASSMPLTPCGR
jgi:hypothetical protein